ncbi:hypothetical protein Hanom_Chr00s001087g01673741 [Helianthus anomalus]
MPKIETNDNIDSTELNKESSLLLTATIRIFVLGLGTPFTQMGSLKIMFL